MVEVTNETDLPLAEEAVFGLAEAVLGGEGAAGDLTVAFVSEQTMAELNDRYRGLPEPTDVLSFPHGADDDWPAGDEEEGEYLGDVVVCPAYAAVNASEEGISLAEELRRLVVHGVLHILGYDHETDAGEMLALQEKLLVELDGRAPLLAED